MTVHIQRPIHAVVSIFEYMYMYYGTGTSSILVHILFIVVERASSAARARVLPWVVGARARASARRPERWHAGSGLCTQAGGLDELERVRKDCPDERIGGHWPAWTATGGDSAALASSCSIVLQYSTAV